MSTPQALVPTIAALRTATAASLPGPSVYVQGYYAAADYGEGTFNVVSGSVTADNGGTVIHDASGRVWYRQTGGGPYNVKWFGAHGNGSTDDTSFFQNALNWCQTVGGGEVTVPVAIYFFSGVLSVPSGCSLVGLMAGRGPDYVNFASTVIAPVLLVTNTGTTFLTLIGGVESATNLDGGSAAVGLMFYYPNQVTWSASTPNVYPPTITAYKTSYMKRLNLVNPYQGISLQGGRSYIIDCIVGALQNALTIDFCYDYVFVSNFNISVSYEYYPLGASYTAEPIDTWVKANRIGIQIRRCDSFKFENVGMFFGNVAWNFIDSTVSQPPYQNSYGQAVNIDIDSWNVGILATSTNPVGGGVQFTNCNMGVNTYYIQTGTGGSGAPYILWNGGAARGGTGATGMNLGVAASVTARHIDGLTPYGSMVAIQPPVPTTTFVQKNFFPWPVQVFTQNSNLPVHVKLNGVAIGASIDSLTLNPGDTYECDYTGTMGWTWFGL